MKLLGKIIDVVLEESETIKDLKKDIKEILEIIKEEK